MSENILNVIYSSDDNYSPHLGASIYSLLSKNENEFSFINIFVIDNCILEDNKRKLQEVVQKYNNAKIIWISFDEYKSKLVLNMAWSISISSYARLFVGSMIGSKVDRVLYLDCDIIVNGSLRDLWCSPIDNYVIGAVQDPVCDDIKKAVGLSAKDRYFNAGMLLINVNKWQELDVEKKAIDFIKMNNGDVFHHDQGVLNGVLKGLVLYLPLKYNVMTMQYFMSRKRWLKFFKNNALYYSQEEYDLSKKEPIVIHFTPSLTSRPWVSGCNHPMKSLYWDAIKNTPWKNMKKTKDSAKWHVKILNLYNRFRPL